LTQNDTHDAGVLPGGWLWTTIGEACEVVLGQSPPSSTYNADGIGLPFYQGKAEFGDLYPTTVKWCSAPKKTAEAGDVLISVRAPVGPTNLCREKSCIGRGLSAVRPLAGMPSSYLLYLLRHIEPDWESKATGTTFSAISGSVLREQWIPLAPLPEQHRIVAEIETQFTRLEAGVAALKRAQANLRRYKAAVLKAACEGRLVPTEAELARTEGRDYEPADVLLRRILAERRARWEAENPRKKYKEPAPPDTSDLPELPEGWVWATIEQVADHRLGKMLDKAKNLGTPRPYLRNLNVRWFGFDMTDIKYMRVTKEELDNVSVREGDLIVCEGGEPGRAAVWGKGGESMVIQKALHRVRPYMGVSPWYLAYRLAADAGTGALEKYFTGSTIMHFTGRSLRSYVFPLPPSSEQQRIIAELERRLSVMGELEKQVEAALRRAERLRQAILKHAFKGKLVPQDPDDEPASALLERIGTQRRTSQGQRRGEVLSPQARQARLPKM
jgi:type I restriction enzyme S subunit